MDWKNAEKDNPPLSCRCEQKRGKENCVGRPESRDRAVRESQCESDQRTEIIGCADRYGDQEWMGRGIGRKERATCRLGFRREVVLVHHLPLVKPESLSSLQNSCRDRALDSKNRNRLSY